MRNPENIYNLFAKKIFNLAFRMTGNKEDANDITQETFIHVLKSIDQFKGESQLYTWLFKIAKNNCLRFLEKRNRTRFLSLQEISEKVSSPIAETISENEKQRYILEVKEGCLSGLLRCLSIQQRLCFILHVLLDLPVSEVARVIEKSENATRILIHRARQNLKKYLCDNCSLYNLKNPCRCENLINFSLKQKWIGQETGINSVNAQIEEEIKDLKSEINIYKTLKEKCPDDGLSKKIQQLLYDKENFLILNDKKVK